MPPADAMKRCGWAAGTVNDDTVDSFRCRECAAHAIERPVGRGLTRKAIKG